MMHDYEALHDHAMMNDDNNKQQYNKAMTNGDDGKIFNNDNVD